MDNVTNKDLLESLKRMNQAIKDVGDSLQKLTKELFLIANQYKLDEELKKDEFTKQIADKIKKTVAEEIARQGRAGGIIHDMIVSVKTSKYP